MTVKFITQIILFTISHMISAQRYNKTI